MPNVQSVQGIDVSVDTKVTEDSLPSTDIEIANMCFSDYLYFLEEIEHR